MRKALVVVALVGALLVPGVAAAQEPSPDPLAMLVASLEYLHVEDEPGAFIGIAGVSGDWYCQVGQFLDVDPAIFEGIMPVEARPLWSLVALADGSQIGTVCYP